jgi:hypothetical protein
VAITVNTPVAIDSPSSTPPSRDSPTSTPPPGGKRKGILSSFLSPIVRGNTKKAGDSAARLPLFSLKPDQVGEISAYLLDLFPAYKDEIIKFLCSFSIFNIDLVQGMPAVLLSSSCVTFSFDLFSFFACGIVADCGFMCARTPRSNSSQRLLRDMSQAEK